MPFLSYRRAIELRQTLKDTQATVVTPEDEGYPDLISRWSEACEREAVGQHSIAFLHTPPIHTPTRH